MAVTPFSNTELDCWRLNYMSTVLNENLVEENNLALDPFELANMSFEVLREKTYWPLFELGEIIISPLAVPQLTSADIERARQQHAIGSWGMVGKWEWRTNDFCLDARMPVTSVYEATNGTVFLVHTDFDRQITEFLLPKEI